MRPLSLRRCRSRSRNFDHFVAYALRRIWSYRSRVVVVSQPITIAYDYDTTTTTIRLRPSATK